MRKLLTILFVLLSFSGVAQIWTKPNNSIGTIANGIGGDRFVYIPTGCGAPTSPANYDSSLKRAGVYFDSCNTRLFIYSPKNKTWGQIIGSGGGGGKDTIYVKYPQQIRDSINGVDTGYVFSIAHGDSIFIHASKVGDSLRFYRMNGSYLPFYIGGNLTLQQVTAAGDTTSNDFHLTDGNGTNIVNIAKDGTTGKVELIDSESGKTLEIGSSTIKYVDGGNSLNIKADSVSGSKTVHLPNVNGTLVATVNGEHPDSDGNINVSAGSGTVESVTGTTPISVDNTDPANPIVSLDNSTATPGTYTNPDVTINAKGIVTAISNGTAPATPTLQESYDVDHNGINAGGNSVHITNADTISLMGANGEEYAYDEATMDFAAGDVSGYFSEIFLNVSDYPTAPATPGDSLTAYVYHDGATISLLKYQYVGETGGQQYYVTYPIAYLVDSVQKVVFTAGSPVNLITNLPDTSNSGFKNVVTSPSGKLYKQASTQGTVTSVSGTSPISVATGTSTPVISLDNSGVTAGTYTNATVTFDAKGRATSASSGSGRDSLAVYSIDSLADKSGVVLKKLKSQYNDTIYFNTTPAYKEYSSNISQTGTSAPVKSEFINTTGATLTWTRNSAGSYTVTASSAIFTSKTQVVLGEANGGLPGDLMTAYYTIDSTTQISVYTQNISVGSADELLNKVTFNFKIYN